MIGSHIRAVLYLSVATFGVPIQNQSLALACQSTTDTNGVIWANNGDAFARRIASGCRHEELRRGEISLQRDAGTERKAAGFMPELEGACFRFRHLGNDEEFSD
jgi:hypothetical protein